MEGTAEDILSYLSLEVQRAQFYAAAAAAFRLSMISYLFSIAMSGGAQPIHICYYSNRCQWSKAFITELSQTPWKGLFRFICADPAPNRPPLPSWLKKVPTLVLSGEPEPRTDADVMNWLYEKKMKEGGGQSQGQSQGHQGPVPGAGGEPEAFSVMEQMSFSKGFGYSGLDVDTSTQGDGGSSIPGAFSFLNGAAAPGDRAQGSFPGGMDDGRRKSKKEELFDKQMEAYQREREIGVQRGVPRQ